MQSVNQKLALKAYQICFQNWRSNPMSFPLFFYGLNKGEARQAALEYIQGFKYMDRKGIPFTKLNLGMSRDVRGDKYFFNENTTPKTMREFVTERNVLLRNNRLDKMLADDNNAYVYARYSNCYLKADLKTRVNSHTDKDADVFLLKDYIEQFKLTEETYNFKLVDVKRYNNSIMQEIEQLQKKIIKQS
jgi:hypothetical protein